MFQLTTASSIRHACFAALVLTACGHAPAATPDTAAAPDLAGHWVSACEHGPDGQGGQLNFARAFTITPATRAIDFSLFIRTSINFTLARSAAALNSGSLFKKSCRPERISIFRSIACRMIFRHDAGILPPGGAMPRSSVLAVGASCKFAMTGTGSPVVTASSSRLVLPTCVLSSMATTSSRR